MKILLFPLFLIPVYRILNPDIPEKTSTDTKKAQPSK
ncbi:hypothetical protein HNP36_000885 [Chryseobacterium shigense]|uniref:Uncharacterized protein n=1 Tax=Chryseobacterium shigense TaxID=297244 RepID=A0A841NCS0_9FLAO|nr:hypothetical protein [Chryseobacterium shigense]